MGEIGGANIEVHQNENVHLTDFLIYDEALLTSEIISAGRYLREIRSLSRPNLKLNDVK